MVDIMSVIIILVQIAVVGNILFQCVEDACLEADWLHQQVSYSAVLVTLHHLFQLT